MHFLRVPPPPALQDLVREFWIVENPDPTPIEQKIIPDGYCEIIFHYGDPYRIKLNDTWQTQERILFSGQISKYFFVQNMGMTGMFGIKLMPYAPAQLFGGYMPDFTDRVPGWTTVSKHMPPARLISPGLSTEQRIKLASDWLFVFIASDRNTRLDELIRGLIAVHGMAEIETLAQNHGMTRRHLEREFKKIVGLTPKYFSRIIQFNYIFEAMQNRDHTWVDIALNSGYFDQSHFISNFKAFTGESPTRYGFDVQNLANFFLKKST